MDVEQLQEIINVLSNKLANANLEHAVLTTQYSAAQRRIQELEKFLEERIETVKVDHAEKK